MTPSMTAPSSMTRRLMLPVRWRCDCDDVDDDDDDDRPAQASGDTLNKLLQTTLKSNELQAQGGSPLAKPKRSARKKGRAS